MSTPIPVRGLHLDLKGLPPTGQRLLELPALVVAAGYNAVLVEWEDSFPWTVDRRFRSETAYSPEDVRAFAAACASHGLELIPLVQCLGHLETVLSVPGFEALREVPHQAQVLNPLAEGARELVQALIDDVLALLPGSRWFHLGGDEAWSFGTHPTTRAFVAEHGPGALYLRHVGPLLDNLNARGIRPILWHDMMRAWDAAALADLRDRADLCVWGYQGHPDTTRHHFATAVIERFVEHGLTLWGATAYKGADGHNSDRPVWANRVENALAWSEVARRYGMRGVFATAWSRYSTHDVQCEPIDGALDTLVAGGLILGDGAAPDEAGALAVLAKLGEQARFEALRDALDALTAARRRGWTAAQQLREWLAMATTDARRRTSGLGLSRLTALRSAVAAAEAAAERVADGLTDRVPALWVERYLTERLHGLREELADLDPRVRLLDPVGWVAG